MLETHLKQHITQKKRKKLRARSQGLSAVALREATLTEGFELALPKVTQRIVMTDYSQ